MYIFIDTNVFLSFYHLTSEDLEELEKLVKLIRDKEITLILTDQVIDEINRNRANKINDSLSPFKKLKFKQSFPAYCKEYPQYEGMKTAIKQAETLHTEMISKIQEDIEKKKLKADLLLDKLFHISDPVLHDEDIIKRAETRVNLGNPPGKKGSLGDAVNWESLLSFIPEKSAVYIITDDADFYSPLSDTKFNDFLMIEWQKKKNSKVNFYRKLSGFFKENFPQISLKTEIEKDKLIEELSASTSFAQTHAMIAKLSDYNHFTQKQAEDLMRAVVNNGQINRIISDEDVSSFYKKLHGEYCLVFSDYYDDFKQILDALEENQNEFDDIPF